VRVVRIVGLLLIVGGIAFGFGERLSGAQATPEATPAAVVRDVIAAGEPATAPGQSLDLVRFTIQPHTKLPVHTHPGMQTAWLVSGELIYTVVSDGEVEITRAATGGTPAATETLTPGNSTTFHPGDAWVEPAGMVHFAENAGDDPVIIIVASLLASDQPPSTVVDVDTPMP
jgi:quercetin dioxygenase-like cupin family protein